MSATPEAKRLGELSPRQWRSGIAAWLGWFFDGLDMHLYTLVATPLVHIGGLWRALACLATGRRMILMPKFAVEPWVSAVERHRLRAASLVPAAIRAVLDAEVPRERLSGLQVVTSGTAPCPPELADAFLRRYGIPVLMTYGATEFAGAVAGFAAVGALAHGSAAQVLNAAPDARVRLWGGFHLPSVGAAIGAVALVTALVEDELAWPLVGFAATGIYLLVIAAQFTIADERIG